MSTSLPVVVIIPGAYHKPECFDKVTTSLKAAGYTTAYVYTPSVGANPVVQSHQVDVEAARAVIIPFLEQGHDVVAVGHSYGGIVLSEAVKGLEKKDGKNGVVHLVYIAAFILQERQRLIDVNIETQYDNDWGIPEPDFQAAYVKEGMGITAFYGDCEPAVAEEWNSKLEKHSCPTFVSVQEYCGWRDFPTTYISCTEDYCIPPKLSRHMLAKCPDVKEVVLKASHSPFLSQPENVVKVIREAAGEKL